MYLVRSIEHVHGEEPKVEVLSAPRVVVELRKRHEDVVVDDAVEEAHSNDRQDSPERVPEQQIRIFVNAVNLSVWMLSAYKQRTHY